MWDTSAIDYRWECIQKEMREGYIKGIIAPYAGQDPATPPLCVTIAICQSRDGFEATLDTEDSYIYWCDPGGQHKEDPPELNGLLIWFNGDKANEWRVHLFNLCMFCNRRFRNLS